jgi:hypothetical protein
MALACWGSAEARALLRALRSSSKEAEGPPSKKPAWVSGKYFRFGFAGISVSVGVGSLEFAKLLVVDVNWVRGEERPRYCIILRMDSPSPVRWLKSLPELGRRTLPVGMCLLSCKFSSSSE